MGAEHDPLPVGTTLAIKVRRAGGGKGAVTPAEGSPQWTFRSRCYARSSPNGVGRVPPLPASAALAASHLAEACRHSSHAYWTEPISLQQEGLIGW